MRAILQAITEELQRLKAAGEQTVAVSDETLHALRALVAAQKGAAGAAKGGEVAASSGEPAKSAFANWQPQSAVPARGQPVKASPAPIPAVAKLPPPPEVTVPEGDKAARWAALRTLVAADAVGTANLKPGLKAVLGAGSLEAKVMFFGDALVAEVEAGGEAYAGAAGDLLVKMVIKGMGLRRDEVWVGNLAIWRPAQVTPEGEEPASAGSLPAEETAYCLPYLRAAVEIVQPELIVALGAAAAQALLGSKFTKLPEVRSRWHEFAGHPVMVTYHPSYVLQSNSAKSKRAVWEDLLKVMERAELPISVKQRGYYL